MLVPLTDVEPAHIGELITGVAETACTVTDDDNALIHLPDAVAVVVITSPDDNVKPVFVHALEVTVAVPCDTPFFKTSITVPFASVLVPLTDVEPSQIGEVITGVADIACTVNVALGVVPPPGVGLKTVINLLPDETISAPDIEAVS